MQKPIPTGDDTQAIKGGDMPNDKEK